MAKLLPGAMTFKQNRPWYYKQSPKITTQKKQSQSIGTLLHFQKCSFITNKSTF